MIRFEVGEGMQKKNEDFAAEVAAQMANSSIKAEYCFFKKESRDRLLFSQIF